MAKNIVIFSDGTGQEGGKGASSNVYKLFNAVEDRSSRQIVFYDRGLGTRGRKIIGGATGKGISKNILECYEFLFDNYQKDDKVYLFGFSRGAFTVRSLAGFIHMFGVLPKARRELIQSAWKIYKKRNPAKRAIKAQQFHSKHHTMWCNVHFLGVWDTVAALGVPFKSMDVLLDRMPWFHHKFHDADLSSAVHIARHALSIDDRRKTFHPTVWNEKALPNSARKFEMESGNQVPRIKQVWFPGVHTDVGGGYAETGLSDISQRWMGQEAVAAGLHVYRPEAIQGHGDPTGIMHDPTTSMLGKIYRKSIRTLAPEIDDLRIHDSVFQRNDDEDSRYDPWLLRHERVARGEFEREL